ncbi:MAG: hypothetical protein MHM6MM_005066 [Cercozoa sp. M6MM]
MTDLWHYDLRADVQSVLLDHGVDTVEQLRDLSDLKRSNLQWDLRRRFDTSIEEIEQVIEENDSQIEFVDVVSRQRELFSLKTFVPSLDQVITQSGIDRGDWLVAGAQQRR